MTLADINKWISGETDAFFGPRQTPSAASDDSSPGEERLSVQESIWKFTHLVVAAGIGSLTSIALIYFVIWMRSPVEPSRAADQKAQSPGSVKLVTGGKVLGEFGWSRPIETSSTEIIRSSAMPMLNQPNPASSDAPLATRMPARKPAQLQPASRRHSVSNEAEREETARLMRDQLPQRGVAADASSGSGPPE